MSLRERAEQDLARTLESLDDFGVECLITNPAGDSEFFTVQSGDIHLLLETDVGIPVNNRTVHVSIRISSLTAKGFSIPRSEPDETKNIWIFQFDDLEGNARKFTVLDAMPDRTLGIVTVLLELMKNAA